MKSENISLEEMMTKILDHSCCNPVDFGDGKIWSKVRIESHCVAWEIIVTVVDNQWVIKEAEAENC